MNIQITHGQGEPLYRQIINQVTYLIASGRLQPGEELLPIRTLAERLVINPNTVARAYLELERSGAVVKRHGSGTFVSEKPPTLSKKRQRSILSEKVDLLLAEARQMGVELDELVSLMQERSSKMNPS